MHTLDCSWLAGSRCVCVYALLFLASGASRRGGLLWSRGASAGKGSCSRLLSGKKKAHKHKSFWPVTPPVAGGSPDREAGGSNFYVLSSEPKEHKSFCPDTRPGGPVTRPTGKRVLCAKVL